MVSDVKGFHLLLQLLSLVVATTVQLAFCNPVLACALWRTCRKPDEIYDLVGIVDEGFGELRFELCQHLWRRRVKGCVVSCQAHRLAFQGSFVIGIWDRGAGIGVALNLLQSSEDGKELGLLLVRSCIITFFLSSAVIVECRIGRIVRMVRIVRMRMQCVALITAITRHPLVLPRTENVVFEFLKNGLVCRPPAL